MSETMKISFKSAIDLGNINGDYDQDPWMNLHLDILASNVDETITIGRIEGILIPCGWHYELSDLLNNITQETQACYESVKNIVESDQDSQDCDTLVILTSATMEERWKGMDIEITAIASLVQRLRLISTPLVVSKNSLLAETQTPDDPAKLVSHWTRMGFKKSEGNSSYVHICAVKENPKADKVIRNFHHELSPTTVREEILA